MTGPRLLQVREGTDFQTELSFAFQYCFVFVFILFQRTLSVLDVFQSLQCCGSHSPRDVTSVMGDLGGRGERTFRTALEIWAPSHAGSLETASANWTLSCQDISDRATALHLLPPPPTPLSLLGVGPSAEAGVTAAGSWQALFLWGAGAGQQSRGPRLGGFAELASLGAWESQC